MISGYKLSAIDSGICLNAYKLLDCDDILLVKPNKEKVIKSKYYINKQFNTYIHDITPRRQRQISIIDERYQKMLPRLKFFIDTVTEKLVSYCSNASHLRPVMNMNPVIYYTSTHNDEWVIYYGVYNSKTKFVYGYTFNIKGDPDFVTDEHLMNNINFNFLYSI